MGMIKHRQEGDTFSSKVTLNMMMNILNAVAIAVVGFLMVPYYISKFGISVYAILPLVLSISSYMLVISDSLADAFSRYVLISLQGGTQEKMNRAFTTSVFGLLSVILMLLPIVLLIGYAAPIMFDTPGLKDSEVTAFFILVIGSSLLVSFSACFSSVFMAYNKLYITYVSKIVYTILQVVLVIIFFYMNGPTLIALGESFLIASIVMILIMVVATKFVSPDLKFGLKQYDRSLLKEMSNLGVWAVLSEIGTLFYIQASLVIVNVTLGAESQGTFAITANIISMINTATSSLAVVAVPLIYRGFANDDKSYVSRTTTIFMKFTGVMMAFPLAFLLAFTPEIITAWLGNGYDIICSMLYIMIPIQLAICTTRILMFVPVAYARMRLFAIVTMMIGVVNVILSVMVLEFTDWGVLGVCAMWVLTMGILRLGFYPIYTAMLMKEKIWNIYKPIIWAYLCFAILLAGGYAIGRLDLVYANLLVIIAYFLLVFFIYFIATLLVLFSKKEKEMIISYLPVFAQVVIKKIVDRD